MTQDQVAALSEAATQGVPVTGNDWLRQFSDDRQLADVLLALYRANQLVLIGPDAVDALRARGDFEQQGMVIWTKAEKAYSDALTKPCTLPNKAAATVIAKALRSAALAALGVK